MAKAKVARKSTAIDMTPMVDLAFLLITFFMLTIKFRPQEAVEVLIPSSIATTPVPVVDLATILISEDGRVFLGVSDQPTRREMLRLVAESKKLDFTEEEMQKFSIMEQVGVPIEQLKQFLSLKPADMNKYLKEKGGIPCDTSDNQLQDWLLQARYANRNIRVAIKADEKTPYPIVREVVNTLKKQRANRFNLITTQEQDPRAQKGGAE